MKLINDLESISKLLRAHLERVGGETVLSIGAGGATPSIVLTVTELDNGLALLSAQTVHGYFELHNVQRYVGIETGEVIFVAEEGEKISGLVVGCEGNCSLFANVRRAILSADLAAIEPSLLLAAMQLGLAENIPA